MKLRFLVAIVVLSTVAVSVWAQAVDMESRIAELRAMPAAERKATLRDMTPEERKGLWFEVKRMDWEEAGVSRSELSHSSGEAMPDRSGGAGPQASMNGGSRAVGTITYDDGVGSITYSNGSIIGNRFNTHTGVPVLASGTIDTVVAVVAQGAAHTTSSAGFVIEGPQTGGGGAMAIFSTFTNAGTAVTETVTFSGLGVNYTGSSFFVLFGDFANSYVPVFGTGTTNSQGHHGVLANTGGSGPNVTAITDIGTQNALIRVSGNVLPVELIEYGVE